MRNSNHSAIFTNKPAPEKACSSDELYLSGPFSEQPFAFAHLGGKLGIEIWHRVMHTQAGGRPIDIWVFLQTCFHLLCSLLY